MAARIPIGEELGGVRQYQYVGGWVDDPHPLNVERILKMVEPFAGEVVTFKPEQARLMVEAGIKFFPMPEKYVKLESTGPLGISNAVRSQEADW